MNANAKKWVGALRSGKYKQAQRALRIEDKFCCLGVACELYALNNKMTWVLQKGQNGGEDKYSFLHYVVALPDDVANWLGLSTENGGYYGKYGEFRTLADANDAGRSFNEIADIIESEPTKLFNA